MKLDQFQQTNLVAVIERANEIIQAVTTLHHDGDLQGEFLDTLDENAEEGGDWERASIAIARVELLERAVRQEDQNVEKFPEGWEGGIRREFIKE
jgi:hypothetical protein